MYPYWIIQTMMVTSKFIRDVQFLCVFAHHTGSFHGGSGDASEDSAGEEPPAPSSVLLKWLTSEGVAVIPRASSAAHLALNSPAAIAAVPDLSRRQALLVADAARALLRGDDRLLPSDLQESLRRRHEEANQREQRAKKALAVSLESSLLHKLVRRIFSSGTHC